MEQTRWLEKPGEEERKILQNIMKEYNIPEGEEQRGSSLKPKQPFSQTIQNLCRQPDTFYKYKRDQREMLELSKIKSKEYKDQKRKELNMLVLYLSVKVNGDRSVSRSDLKKLAKAGLYRSPLLNKKSPEPSVENSKTSMEPVASKPKPMSVHGGVGFSRTNPGTKPHTTETSQDGSENRAFSPSASIDSGPNHPAHLLDRGRRTSFINIQDLAANAPEGRNPRLNLTMTGAHRHYGGKDYLTIQSKFRELQGESRAQTCNTNHTTE